MDGSPPSFSVHGISQARIPEWVTISYSREFPQVLPFWKKNQYEQGITLKQTYGTKKNKDLGTSELTETLVL